MRTREEHLAWAKARALEYVDRGELDQALASMGSDLNKHDETRRLNAFVMFGLPFVMNKDTVGMRRWIRGFR